MNNYHIQFNTNVLLITFTYKKFFHRLHDEKKKKENGAQPCHTQIDQPVARNQMPFTP